MITSHYLVTCWNHDGSINDQLKNIANYAHGLTLFNLWCKKEPLKRIIFEGFTTSGHKILEKERPQG